MSGDCGGTNTRLVLFRVAPGAKAVRGQQPVGEVILSKHYRNAENASFVSCCERFLSETDALTGGLRPKACCLACAGGIVNNTVTFTNVKDGATVPSTFTYQFDVSGYKVSPAKDGIIEGTGHHHMIIDGPDVWPKGEVIPMDATHKHYGKGQSEGELVLEPGKHTITLQFANALHESYGKEFAKKITVNVQGA